MSKQSIAIGTSVFSILINLVLAIIKLLAGIFGHSFALIADAIESTGDIFASVAVYLGLKYSMKPKDETHPYGHGKAEAISTFVVVVFLIIGATIIMYQGIINIFTPHHLPHIYTLYILATIIITKEIIYRVVKRNSKLTNSTSLSADAWHHRADAITSGFAFVGIMLAIYLGDGYEYMDDIAAIIASFMIYYNSYKIFRPALAEVMDEHLYDDLILDIKTKSLDVEGILDTEKCMVRKMGMNYIVDLHIIVDKYMTVEKGHHISHILKDYLMDDNDQIQDVLIHIEPN